MSPGVLSPWVVLPIAGLLLLAVAILQIAVERSEASPSRKRIRMVNGWVMLLTIPMLAAGFSLVSPAAHPQAFVLVWAAGLGLLCIVVFLAMLDVINTWRLTKSSRGGLHDAYHSLASTARRAAQNSGDEPAPPPAPAPAPGERDAPR